MGPSVSWILGLMLAASSFPADVGAVNPGNFIRSLVNSHGPSLKELPWREYPNGTVERPDVMVGFALHKLLEVNLHQGYVKVSGWHRLYWYDYRFSFDGPKHFKNFMTDATDTTDSARLFDKPWNSNFNQGSVAHLHVSSDDIWVPDVTLQQQVDGYQENTNQHAVNVFDKTFVESLEARGLQRFNMYWSRATVFVMKCNFTLRDFPFDFNDCPMLWEAWSENQYKLSPAPDVSKTFTETKEYKVTLDESRVERGTKKYPLPGGGDFGSFGYVQFHLKLERFSHYYVINYIMPIATMVVLAWLTFFIPLMAESHDRIAYATTLLLTVMAVNFITAEKRPATNEDMWLDQFQTWAFISVFVPIVQTVALLRINRVYELDVASEDAIVQYELAQVVNYIDRLFRMGYPVALSAICFSLFGPFSSAQREVSDWDGTATIIYFVFIGGTFCAMTAYAFMSISRRGRKVFAGVAVGLQESIKQKESLNEEGDDESDDESLEPDDHVEYKSRTDRYPAKINGVNDDGTYELDIIEHAVWHHVEYKSRTDGSWYPAKIKGVNDDGTYKLDIIDHAAKDRVRPRAHEMKSSDPHERLLRQ